MEALADPECGWFYRRDASAFEVIPGSPIAYWASDAIIEAFASKPRADRKAIFAQGLKPAPGELFIRMRSEVSLSNTFFTASKPSSETIRTKKWYPISNGGDYRKWYGNRHSVVDWLNNGEGVRNSVDENGKRRSRVQSERYYFLKSLSWSALTSGPISVRRSPEGSICAGAGYYIGAYKNEEVLFGFLNSSIIVYIKQLLSPTMNNEVGDLSAVPLDDCDKKASSIAKIVTASEILTKCDWDAIEISWDFQRHPLI